MGLLIALAPQFFPIPFAIKTIRVGGQQDLWDLPQRLTELNGQLLLIVGYGSIGREPRPPRPRFRYPRLGRHPFRKRRSHLC